MTLSPHDLRPRRLALAAAVSITASLGAATGVQAQAGGCVGPPGASAVEQYCEAIPRADGGRSQPGTSGSGSSSGTGNRSGTSTLSPKAAEALTEAGADGAAVSRLADDGTTTKEASGSGSGGSGSDGAAEPADGATETSVAAPTDASGSPLKAATNAVESGPTVGPALAWGVVGMSAVGAAGALILRRRTHTIPPAKTDETSGGGD